ncbi:MAG TPA: hypothetical protein G4O03_08745 [Dehalococcoidia bacterium]|jgi:hypothetical protein|nr:hypothetical protein [Dehalococcoidia bacterium]
MPITRKQFELEIDREIEEWMKKIHDFLAKRKEEAFSAEELYRTFTGRRLRIPPTEDEEGGYYEKEGIDFDAALEKLVEIAAVEKRIIRAEDYYCWLGPLIL